jgi:hypothetical protein
MKAFHVLIPLHVAAVSSAAQLQPVVTVGGGRSTVELGTILDVVALPSHFLILDKNAPHLRLVDQNGQLRQTVGRAGSGPGEYLVPSAVAFDSAANRVLVVDRANARVTEYHVGDTLRLGRTLPTNVVNLLDVCVSKGKLFGISGSKTTLLEELEIQDGRLVSKRGLGKPRSSHPLANHPMVVGRSSWGPLYCDPSGFVWIASKVLGDVHRVNIGTGEHQTVAVRDFHPIRLQAEAGGALSFSAPDGWYEEISGVVTTSSGLRVVLTSLNRDGSVREYQFLDLASDLSSQGSRIASKWRQIDGSSRRAVCIVDDPVPMVTVFNGGRCP